MSVTIATVEHLTWRGKRAASSRSCVITTIVAPSALKLVEQRQDRGAGRAVEVARRLVGEHDRRPSDERARDRDPLPLAAGELRRPAVEPVAEPDRREQRLAACARRSATGTPRVEQPVGDVLERRRVLGEEELLEDEADPRRAQRGELAVRELGDVEAGDRDPARGRAVERAHEVQQRRLAGAGGADDRDQLAARRR